MSETLSNAIMVVCSKNSIVLVLFPGPHPAFVTCSTEKRGEHGIFSPVSTV